MKKKLWIFVFALVLVLCHATGQSASQPIQVRVNRWLEIRQVKGAVTYHKGPRSQQAKGGDRLQSVGDGVSTGQRATTTLAVDTGIGFITVAENTQVRLRSLDIASDNGRITRLEVTGGQVRLQVRRFTNSGSRLEIQTPAGLSGVRGTDFGVNVHPTGKTGVATLSGKVDTTAQGQVVPVGAGYQNFTMPGEPPSPAVPLTNDTSLKSEFSIVINGNIRRAKLMGQVDPVNTVLIDGNPQATDRQGRFSTLLPLPSFLKVQVTVTTPLGKTQVHELAFR